jgi:iron complex transport system substrate-binding protein
MLRIAIIALLTVFTSLTGVQAREITDMAGRKVTVPKTIRRVYASSPPSTYMIYAIDPSLLVGVNSKIPEENKRFLSPRFSRLPVAGGLSGQGRTLNMEILLAAKPDIVLMWAENDGGAGQQMAERLHKSGITTVFLRLGELENYPEAFTFLGDLLNRRERTRKLADYTRETLRSVAAATAKIPDRERRAVYYAEGTDGLATDRELSPHAALIRLAGAKNVHQGKPLDNVGRERISLEQVLLYNPQVIVAQEQIFVDSLARDERWQGIRAVKDKRVILIPRKPFNWFDRPPSFMRLLGLRWFTNKLYPKYYPIDIVRETREFYRLFLGVELSKHDIEEILDR